MVGGVVAPPFPPVGGVVPPLFPPFPPLPPAGGLLVSSGPNNHSFIFFLIALYPLFIGGNINPAPPIATVAPAATNKVTPGLAIRHDTAVYPSPAITAALASVLGYVLLLNKFLMFSNPWPILLPSPLSVPTTGCSSPGCIPGSPWPLPKSLFAICSTVAV